MSIAERVREHLHGADDYTVRAVPHDRRRSPWDLWFVGVALFFVINTLWNGGLLASQLTFGQLVAAALIGAFINACIAVTIAYIAAKQGTNLALLARYSFGSIGFLLPVLLLSLVIIGFAALGVGISSLFSAQLTPLKSRILWMILFTILIGISSTSGLLGLLRVSQVSVPLILLGIFTSFFLAVGELGGFGGLLALRGTAGSMTLGAAVSLVIAQWIAGVLLYMADVFRFARTPRSGAKAAFCAVMIGQPIFTIAGGVLVQAYGIPSFPELGTVFALQGIALFGWLTLFLSAWTTMDNEVYSSSTALGNAFVVSRLKWEPVVLLLALIGAMVGIADRYFAPFLGVIGATIPPVAGVIIADYFLLARGQYPSPAHVVSLRRRFQAPEGVSLPVVKWSGIVGWLAGFIWAVYFKQWIPAIEGLIVAGVVHAVVGSFIRQGIQVTDPEKFRLFQEAEAEEAMGGAQPPAR